MKKLILFTAVCLFFSGCNRTSHSTSQSPLSNNDSLARNVLSVFDEKPLADKIYVKVQAREDHYLSPRNSSIKSFLESLKEPPQHFTISSTELAEVKGKHGTKFTFNAGCFLNKNGKTVSTPVDIQLKECYSVNEMFNEDLTNTGDKVERESKSAFYITAQSAGEELKLKEGEHIKVQFPFAPVASNYQLYYVTKDALGALQWVALQNGGLDQTTVKGDLKDFNRPEFSFNGLSFSDYLLQVINYPDDAKRNELSAKVDVTFRVDKRGRATNVVIGESYKTFKQEIAKVLAKMPAWKPATYNNAYIPAEIHLDIDFNIRRADQVRVDFNEASVRLMAAANGYYAVFGNDDNAVDGNQPVTCLISEPGWYNFARIVNPVNSRADVIIQDDNATEARLVLKNKKSLAAGEDCVGYSRFKAYPVGSDVYLVALKVEKGKTFYALQPLKLKKQNIISPVWKEGGKAEFETELKKMLLSNPTV